MSHVMWSIAQIAARDGVSKPAVSKTVKKLLEDRPETPVDRGTQGQVMRVSLAHYDHYRQRHVNPAKATAPLRDVFASAGEERSQPLASSLPIRDEESFEEARRQSEWLKVGREKIRREEECGRLIRKDIAEEGMAAVGAEAQAVIRRLSNRADAIALAVSKEGVHGVRVLLRKIAFEMGCEIADKIDALARRAPETDPLIEDQDA